MYSTIKGVPLPWQALCQTCCLVALCMGFANVQCVLRQVVFALFCLHLHYISLFHALFTLVIHLFTMSEASDKESLLSMDAPEKSKKNSCSRQRGKEHYCALFLILFLLLLLFFSSSVALRSGWLVVCCL